MIVYLNYLILFWSPHGVISYSLEGDQLGFVVIQLYTFNTVE